MHALRAMLALALCAALGACGAVTTSGHTTRVDVSKLAADANAALSVADALSATVSVAEPVAAPVVALVQPYVVGVQVALHQLAQSSTTLTLGSPKEDLAAAVAALQTAVDSLPADVAARHAQLVAQLRAGAKAVVDVAAVVEGDVRAVRGA